MRRRVWAGVIGAAAVAVGGLTVAQQPAPPLPPAVPQLSPPRLDTLPTAPPVEVTAPPRPADLTIEQLLEAVDRVQAQKAELERRERELLQALRGKAERLKERLTKLGLGDQPTPPSVPTIPGG